MKWEFPLGSMLVPCFLPWCPLDGRKIQERNPRTGIWDQMGISSWIPPYSWFFSFMGQNPGEKFHRSGIWDQMGISSWIHPCSIFSFLVSPWWDKKMGEKLPRTRIWDPMGISSWIQSYSSFMSLKPGEKLPRNGIWDPMGISSWIHPCSMFSFLMDQKLGQKLPRTGIGAGSLGSSGNLLFDPALFHLFILGISLVHPKSRRKTPGPGFRMQWEFPLGSNLIPVFHPLWTKNWDRNS